MAKGPWTREQVAELARRLMEDLAQPDDAALEKRHLDLWQMLVWVYAQQRAHAMLKRKMDWFNFAVSVALGAEDQGPRPAVHRDAAVMHAAVMGLGEAAPLLIDAAVNMVWPAYTLQRPVLRAVANERGNGGAAHAVRGEWVQMPMIVLTAAERARAQLAGAPIVVTRGRGGVWQFRVDPRPVRRRRRGAVLEGRSISEPPHCSVYSTSCPVAEHPPQAYLDYVNRCYDVWRSGMLSLGAQLPGYSFRNHAVAAIDIPQRPVMAEES